MITFRPAVDGDREQIAYCIAEAFKKDFSLLSRKTKSVAKAFERGIRINHFFVAQEDGNKIVGALAIADRDERSMSTDLMSYLRYFGPIRGLIAKKILKDKFEKPLDYSKPVAFFEMFCVLQSYQGQGIGKKLLEYCMEDRRYVKFVVNVKNVNQRAIRYYEKLGFIEIKREKVRFPRQRGFEERIYMRYDVIPI